MKWTPQKILDRKIDSVINGYSPTKVDNMLDEIINDYEEYDKTILNLNNEIKSLQNEIKKLQTHLSLHEQNETKEKINNESIE